MPKHGKKQLVTEQSYKVGQIARSGSLAMAVAGVLALSSFQTLDNSLTVSLFAFSIAIPFLSASVIIDLQKQFHNYFGQNWYATLLSSGGLISMLIGIAAIFFHFSIGAGLTFIGASVLSFIIGGPYILKIEKTNKDES